MCPSLQEFVLGANPTPGHAAARGGRLLLGAGCRSGLACSTNPNVASGQCPTTCHSSRPSSPPSPRLHLRLNRQPAACRRSSAISRRRRHRPLTPGFVADSASPRAGRDRRHPADVRRRPALLDGDLLAVKARAAGRARADRRRHRHWLGLASIWGWSLRGAWSSALRSRWRAPSCCCARWRSGTCRHRARPDRGRLARSSRISRWCWRWSCCRRSHGAARAGGDRQRPATSQSTSLLAIAQGRGLRRSHAVVGKRLIPRPALRRAYRLARAVPARGARDRARRRVGAAYLFGVSFALGAFFAA